MRPARNSSVGILVLASVALGTSLKASKERIGNEKNPTAHTMLDAHAACLDNNRALKVFLT